MKSKAATFKVKITKSKTRALKRRSKKLVQTLTGGSSLLKIGYRKHEGVNLYMSESKPAFIPNPPEELLLYITRKIEKLDSKQLEIIMENNRKANNSRKTVSARKKHVNEFIAFRSYYSRMFNGIISQTELSSIISGHWAANKNTRRMWEFISQQYNCDNSTFVFNEWLERNYKVNKTLIPCIEKTKLQKNTTSSGKIPYVENIFITNVDNMNSGISEDSLTIRVEETPNILDWVIDPTIVDGEYYNEISEKWNYYKHSYDLHAM